MIKKVTYKPLVFIMITVLVLFNSGCFLTLFSDYPNYKSRFWITNNVYSLYDTIFVEDYILVHYHDSPFFSDDSSLIAPYLTQHGYEDSIFGIFKQSLLKDSNKTYKFSDSPSNVKEVISKYHDFNTFIKQKKINSAFFCKFINCSKTRGYNLIPIIEISYSKNHSACFIIITMAVFNNNNSLIYKKSMGRVVSIPDNRFYYYDFVPKERYKRNNLPIVQWEKTILEIMEDFK